MQIYTDIPITSLDDLDTIHEKYSYNFYRGLSSVQHRLLPSLTRQIKTLRDAEEAEFFIWNKLLEKPEILRICGYKPASMNIRQEWELMAQCRHAGLWSRMLDITSKDIVALYFACCADYDSDGIFWELIFPFHVTLSSQMQQHPCEVNEMKLIHPDIFGIGEELYNTASHKNAMHQWSRLLIQPMKDALIPLEEQSNSTIIGIKHIVPKEFKQKLYREISDLRKDFILAPNNELEKYVSAINNEVEEKFCRVKA